MYCKPNFDELTLHEACIIRDAMGSSRKIFKAIKSRISNLPKGRGGTAVVMISKRVQKELQSISQKFLGLEVPLDVGESTSLCHAVCGDEENFDRLLRTRRDCAFWLTQVKNLVLVAIYNLDSLYFELSQVIKAISCRAAAQIPVVVEAAIGMTKSPIDPGSTLATDTTVYIPAPPAPPAYPFSCQRKIPEIRNLARRKRFE